MADKKKCDCNDDARLSTGALGGYARDLGRVVAGRVTNSAARSLADYCSRHRCTQSEALRKALTVLAAATDDPQSTLAAVATALGLPPETGSAVVAAAWADLLDQLEQADAAGPASAPLDPSAPGADPTPAPPGAVASLSQNELNACRRYGLSPADYLRHRYVPPREAATPSPTTAVAGLSRELRARIKDLGLSENEYAERIANAVRRV